MTEITEWTGTPVEVSTWVLLTPPPGILTTINQLGNYTVEFLGGILVSAGYTPPTGTEWTRG